MVARRFFIPLAMLATLAPTVVGSGNATMRGRLLPDLPQHLEVAQKGLDQGALSDALAHVSLVLMDRPIRYRVRFEDVSEERQPECLAAFRDAVAMWESALDKELRFEEATGDQSAELTVVFRKDVKQNGASVAGFVNWKRHVRNAGNGSEPTLTAEIKVRTEQPGGAPMSLEHMRHTAAHELGHVLGLDDSPFYGDIMGPLDLKHPVTGFEASELGNLRELRTEAHQVRRQALARVP